MKKINYVKILLLTTLLWGFTSCESDHTIFDDLVGRTWVGDLGFNYGDAPVESEISFSSDGFATDNQYYFPEDGGRFATSLPIRWRIEYGTLYLDYGNRYPMLEIRGVDISGPNLRGRLYADGVDEGNITLTMRY